MVDCPVDFLKRARRRRVRRIILAVVLAALLAAGGGILLKVSYYPMAGENLVIDKGVTIFGQYYITIQQGPTLTGKTSNFRLRCTEEQYLSVSVGETVDCGRIQSAITHRGVLHRIYDR